MKDKNVVGLIVGLLFDFITFKWGKRNGRRDDSAGDSRRFSERDGNDIKTNNVDTKRTEKDI